MQLATDGHQDGNFMNLYEFVLLFILLMQRDCRSLLDKRCHLAHSQESSGMWSESEKGCRLMRSSVELP